jgi:hypothetical protein
MLPMLTDINASELPSAAMIARLGQEGRPRQLRIGSLAKVGLCVFLDSLWLAACFPPLVITSAFGRSMDGLKQAAEKLCFVSGHDLSRAVND